jgi:hypothetical protein
MLTHFSDPEPPEDHRQFILSVPEPIRSTLFCFWTSRAKVVVDRHPIYPNTDPSTANLYYVRGAGGRAKGRIDLYAAWRSKNPDELDFITTAHSSEFGGLCLLLIEYVDEIAYRVQVIVPQEGNEGLRAHEGLASEKMYMADWLACKPGECFLMPG